MSPFTPGIHRNVDEKDYHADPALSSSGARRLLKVSPHRWRYEQDHPRTTSTDYFDLGTAVHTLVLGTGAPLVDVGFESWSTKAAKEARQEAWDAGKVPLRSQDYDTAHDMAVAVRRHPRAAELLATGEPEVSAWWDGYDAKVMLRARADWMHWIDTDTAVIVDLKTTPAATPDEFRKSVDRFGYHAQQAFYQAVFGGLGIRTAFLFVVVVDEPPHEVYVVELPGPAVDLGAALNRRAIDLYAECLRSGVWPDHGDHIHEIDLPSWAYARETYR